MRYCDILMSSGSEVHAERLAKEKEWFQNFDLDLGKMRWLCIAELSQLSVWLQSSEFSYYFSNRLEVFPRPLQCYCVLWCYRWHVNWPADLTVIWEAHVFYWHVHWRLNSSSNDDIKKAATAVNRYSHMLTHAKRLQNCIKSLCVDVVNLMQM